MPIIDDSVIPYDRRSDERVQEGRNKVRVIIGTDRRDTVDSGYGSGEEASVDSGAFIVTVGGDEQDLNLEEDDVIFMMSGKTDPDDYLQISAGDKKTGIPAASLKSDNVYLVARDSLKLVSSNFNIIITNDQIVIQNNEGMKIVLTPDAVSIGEGAEQRTPLGESLDTWLKNLTVDTAMGPAKINAAHMSTFISDVLSTKVRIE